MTYDVTINRHIIMYKHTHNMIQHERIPGYTHTGCVYVCVTCCAGRLRREEREAAAEGVRQMPQRLLMAACRANDGEKNYIHVYTC